MLFEIDEFLTGFYVKLNLEDTIPNILSLHFDFAHKQQDPAGINPVGSF
jgi:hypothetical protein